ncbi:MAG: hypothetical protein Q9O24_08435 [Gammaproteobacteria bacterium]|nr:hypothetical protein [Gammaproteobacteria bacterium]
MIHHLLALQFTLLYLPLTYIALGVYGSNFKGLIGAAYLAPLLLIPLLQRMLKNRSHQLSQPWVTILLPLIGTLSALLLYSPLHLHHWDEYSVRQALLTGLLGIVSYLIAYSSALQLKKPSSQQLFSALLILAFCWSLSWYSPLAGFFMLALIFSLSPFAHVQRLQPLTLKPLAELSAVLSYSLMLLIFDLTMVVWDYQEMQQWALHFTVALLAIALSMLFLRSILFNILILLAAISNFIYCILVPSYLLNLSHSALAGLAIGVLLFYRSLDQTGKLNPQSWISLSLPVFGGFFLSFAFYHNLPILAYRWLLVIPLLLLLRRYYKRNIA